MARERTDIEDVLSAKGFACEEAAHRKYYYKTIDGLTTSVQTIISTGTGYRTYPDFLLQRMARSLKLQNADFKRLLDCPMNQAEYEQKLIDGGHIRK